MWSIDNPNNRISLVTFGKTVSTVLPFNYYKSSDGTYVKYIKPTSGEYGTIASAGLTYADGQKASFSYKMDNVVTYTQGRIIGGSRVLKNASNKKIVFL